MNGNKARNHSSSSVWRPSPNFSTEAQVQL